MAWTLALLATTAWGIDTLDWQRRRSAEARAASTTAAAQELLADLDRAGKGDVRLYSWDATFLNDEPEHLDPVLSALPSRRLGRVCSWDAEMPSLCNRSRDALLLFDPNLMADDFEANEESLRLAVNLAEPPGSATLYFVPQDAERARRERPWVLERWMRSHGGVLDELEGGPILRVRFPPGTRIGPPASPAGTAE